MPGGPLNPPLVTAVIDIVFCMYVLCTSKYYNYMYSYNDVQMQELFDEMQQFAFFMPNNLRSFDVIEVVGSSFIENAEKQFKTFDKPVLERVVKLSTDHVFAKIDKEANRKEL